MKQKDLAYYRRRLATEKDAARTASNPAAARCHAQMAYEYLSLIEASGEQAAEEPTHQA